MLKKILFADIFGQILLFLYTIGITIWYLSILDLCKNSKFICYDIYLIDLYTKLQYS